MQLNKTFSFVLFRGQGKKGEEGMKGDMTMVPQKSQACKGEKLLCQGNLLLTLNHKI